MRTSATRPAGPLIGVVVLLLGWQLLAAGRASVGQVVPGPAAIVGQFVTDGLGQYLGSAYHTGRAALLGWLWGNIAAIAAVVLAVVVPRLEALLLRLGVVSYCLPIVAIGPLFSILFSADTSRQVLAALAVFFMTLVIVTAGLRTVDPGWLDVVAVHGGTARTNVVKVRLPAILPSLALGLQASAPAAVLGAIVGEYIGADDGLGVMMINAQQATNAPRTWCVALVATVLAGVGYAVLGLLGRVLLPWRTEIAATELRASTAPHGRNGSDRPWARQMASSVASVIGSVVAILLVWEAFLAVFDVSPFIGKRPLDVLAYLTGPKVDWAALGADAAITVRDSLLGLTGGALVAFTVAAMFSLVPWLGSVLMPVALAMRAVPLVALTPVVVLAFGRGFAGVLVIAAIVSFFPTLVGVVDAFRRTPAEIVDVVRATGGSRWQVLRRVQVVTAIPVLFTSMRAAAPLAVAGALLAEWLATGQGFGSSMSLSLSTSNYLLLWSQVVLATTMCAALYFAVGLLERGLLTLLAHERRDSATTASTEAPQVEQVPPRDPVGAAVARSAAKTSAPHS
ncbi:ABC transporter permease subunit [Pseudonocardia kujensis]|uniref:ABC transporter permease n=1 Tax=Pseudonocardia kujensis TaxID=1128675 RepID=UPI001E40E868|nr:ABC transporter permease subunit [Pseudonocardia kujensis]MCE0764933.1 ABC transporter permease subunit [Pseudonocardia kujensis]